MGHLESGIRQPIEAYIEKKRKGLGYRLPATRGTTTEGHAFTNIQNSLIEVEGIPQKVEKKAYDDIFLDKIIQRASVLY